MAMWLSLFEMARADYRDDIGYTKLQAELGAALPTGSGVGVSQIEAPEQTINNVFIYLPDTTLAEFSGKTFTPLSPGSGVSGHATTVAQFFQGRATSVAPGVTGIHLYEANHWISSGFLNHGFASPPRMESQKITNSSWIGATGDTASDAEILRRFDYAILQSGFLGVVALNNGDNNGQGNNVPALLASSYNGVSVGVANGNHSWGTNTADGIGRTKSELVAPSYATSNGTPLYATSYATPMVASVAATLVEVAPANARQPVTLKAILMAGATKDQFPAWSRSATQPLDAVFGAGQVNIYRSYHILAAGQQAADTAFTVTPTGWDYTTTTTGSRLYFFDIVRGGPSSLSVVLTWHRTISDAFPDPLSSLANLTLRLYAASDFTTCALLDASTSAVDNVEHIWQPALSAGRYALEVTGDSADVAYGLAWSSVPTVSIAATTPAAEEFGAVPGIFTITRGGDTAVALTVSYAITGTAVNGTDCASIPASVTIPAGASTATVTVKALPDTLAEGDETVVLTLSADPAYSFGVQIAATVTIHDKPADAWRFSKFTAAELGDASLSGDLADFEKDGIKNLHEYAFALEPKTSDTPGLPVAFLQPGGALAIAYTRVKSAVDITYVVEVSNDLVTWFSGPSSTALIGTDDHGATETVKVGSLLPPGTPKRQFMRVRVTLR